MKPEVIINNWLMAWLKPDKKTAYNKSPREPLTEANFGKFIQIFQDDKGQSFFTEEERATLKEVIKHGLSFGTGYPRNVRETIRLATVYIIGAGWRQTESYLGTNRWYGRASTHITVTGTTTGETLNMAEPSLLLQMITSLLIAGRNYFTMHHLLNPVIAETMYGQDEANSYQREKPVAMRSLTLEYDAERYGVITHG